MATTSKTANLKLELEVNNYSREQVQEIAKCMNSVVYFAENYYYITHPLQGLTKIDLRIYQKNMMQRFQDNRFNIVMASRQCGKSTSVCIYLLWRSIFKEHQKIIMIANTAQRAVENLGNIKLAYERLPGWIKPGIISYNTKLIKFDNGSAIQVYSPKSGVARGTPASLLYLDEFAHIEPPAVARDFWNSAFPIVSVGGDIIITSTPKGVGNKFYDIWVDTENKGDEGKFFVPYIVDWREVPGRDEKWKQEQIRALGSEVAFNQEYANQFIGSEHTLIDGNKIGEIIQHCEQPLSSSNFDVMYYKEPIDKHKYLISGDASKGVKHDFSVGHVIDLSVYPYEQVCVIRYNTKNEYDFAKDLFDLAVRYNRAYIIVENNTNGETVLKELKDTYEYDNLYYNVEREEWGIIATKKTKRIATSLLKKYLEMGMLKINDKQTAKELSTYIEEKPNIFNAKKSPNIFDDTITGLYWGVYFIDSDFWKDIKGGGDGTEEKKDKDDDGSPWEFYSTLQEDMLAAEKEELDNWLLDVKGKNKNEKSNK